MRSTLFAAAAVLAMGTDAAFSCPDNCLDLGAGCVCNPLPDPPPLPKPPEEFGTVVFPPAVAVMAAAARAAGDENGVAAAHNLEAIGAKFDKEMQTAISNALTNPAQGIKDARETCVKAANDIVDAVHASARYAERTVSGYADALSNAGSRAREGKVADAIWHLGADKLRINNENAAKFMQESEAARQAAQAAAGAYGGPAGSAAFAAWYAYNSSTPHDVGAALRAGAYTYAVGQGLSKVNAMPAGTVDEVAEKAAATAAVRGMAVAAAGGTKEDILNAAAQGGGSVIVQSGQAYVTKEYVDPTTAKADAFCTDAVKTSCADAKQWLTDSKNRLKQYKSDALPNTVITNDGLWAISWDKKVLLDRNSRAPGVVLTYIGDGSPYKEQMLRLAALGDRAKFTPPVVESTSWAAFSDPGGASPYFDLISLAGAASVRPDDLLKANRTVNVRPGPSGGGWRAPIDVLARGETVKVLQVKIAETKYGPQEWIRFDRVKQ